MRVNILDRNIYLYNYAQNFKNFKYCDVKTNHVFMFSPHQHSKRSSYNPGCGWSPGVNFTNILLAAFTLVIVKKYS